MRFDECMAVLNLSPLVYTVCTKQTHVCMYVCIKWNVCSILKMITYGLNVCMLINTSIGMLACMYMLCICVLIYVLYVYVLYVCVCTVCMYV